MAVPNTVLVAGGAGFIGSHLADALIDGGGSVICVDNLFSGSLRNIEHLFDHENFRFRRHDICDPLDLRVDQIYNLASVGASIAYPETAETVLPVNADISVHGVVNLLKLAASRGCKIFHASGSEVYDDPIEAPRAALGGSGPDPVRYLASYCAGRRFAESLVFDFSRKNRLDFKIGRIFSVYGPRMPLGVPGSVGDLVVNALQGRDLDLGRAGDRLLSLCYVDDVVQSCIRLMASPPGISGPMDIGPGNEISLLALARRILSLTGGSGNIIGPQGEAVYDHRPDLQPARESLGWQAATLLEAGLTRTIEYFEDLLRAGSLRACADVRFSRRR